MKVKLIVRFFFLLLVFFFLNSCFASESSEPKENAEKEIISESIEKTDVEVAKENEDRLPYTKERISLHFSQTS